MGITTEQIAAAVREGLEPLAGRMTEYAAALRGNSLNQILRSETIIIGGTSGRSYSHRNFAVPFAMVGAWALEDEITVVAGPVQGDTAPRSGIGVMPVMAGTPVVWPLTGNELAIYGTAGQRVLLAVWARAVDPAASLGAVIGGSP
jgi:hypothetical protein